MLISWFVFSGDGENPTEEESQWIYPTSTTSPEPVFVATMVNGLKNDVGIMSLAATTVLQELSSVMQKLDKYIDCFSFIFIFGFYLTSTSPIPRVVAFDFGLMRICFVSKSFLVFPLQNQMPVPEQVSFV